METIQAGDSNYWLDKPLMISKNSHSLKGSIQAVFFV